MARKATPPRQLPPLEASGIPQRDKSLRPSKSGSDEHSRPLSAPASPSPHGGSTSPQSSSVASYMPSPTVGWRKEQSLAPLQLIPNMGTLDASRNAWKSLSSDSVPPGLDRESYMAGERSAMLRLFQEVLPSQQALGALAAAVQRLQDDMAGLAEVEGTTKAVQAGLHAVKDRVVELEHRRLPALEVRMDAVQHSAAPEELVRVLQALHGLNEGMMSAHEAERLWTRKSALQRALISVRSWLVGSVSQMDVALLFLSRRLLLGSYSGEASGSEGGAASARGKWSGHRAAVGAALFVAFVEAGWRAQKAGVSHLPWPANRLVKPLRPGLSVLRTLCWTAVLTLGAHEVRRLCFSAAFLGTDRQDAKPGQECTEPRP